MSGVHGEVVAAGQTALCSLLARWPVTCEVERERPVSDAGEDLAFPALVVVTQGSLWVLDRESKPEHLEAGDVVVVHEAGRLSLSPTLPEGLADATDGPWLSGDPLKSPIVLVVKLESIGTQFSPRLTPKPYVIRDRSTSQADGALRTALVEAVRGSLSWPVANVAATALYLQCIESHLRSQPQDVQLLAGLFDPEIGPVVASLLETPAHDWTVESLAEVGGMSRSAFARKFRDLMGAAPIDFLVEVRMWQAARLLRQQAFDLKTIARDAGYQSPAAFSVAFKRWSGETPSDFRRQA